MEAERVIAQLHDIASPAIQDLVEMAAQKALMGGWVQIIAYLFVLIICIIGGIVSFHYAKRPVKADSYGGSRSSAKSERVWSMVLSVTVPTALCAVLSPLFFIGIMHITNPTYYGILDLLSHLP